MSRTPPLPVRHHLLHAALSIGLATALPGAANAARINYEIGASLLYSDNIDLRETDAIGESVFSPQLRFDAQQAGSALQFKLRGSLQYLDYLGNEFGDEWRGEFAGEGNWTVVPERIDFVFQDYLSRQPVSVLNAFSPANQQQVNVFVMGPSFRGRFGDVTRGQLDLRYSNTYAEDTEAFNSDRYNLAARLLRELGDARQLSGNVEAMRVDYDLAGDAFDFTRYDAYLGYTSTFKSLDFGIEAGYSTLQLRLDGERASSPLFRGNVNWRIAPRSTLNGIVSYQFSDAAQSLVTSTATTPPPDTGDVPLPGIGAVPNVYRLRRVEAGYRFTGERFKLQIQPYYQRIRYLESNGLDESLRGGYLVVDYALRPRLSLTFTASRVSRRFDDQSREDVDTFLNLGLRNQFTPHWSGQVDFQYRARNSTGAGQSYDENAAIVSFTYRR